jgi:hypothetical protein
MACVKNTETAILGEGPETIAEVLVEPIMSGVGVAVPPDEYLPGTRFSPGCPARPSSDATTRSTPGARLSRQ